MIDPSIMSPGSIMPTYDFMVEDDLDISTLAEKIRVMQKLGVPYPSDYDQIAVKDLEKQSIAIADDLKKSGISVDHKKEIIAMIAYLQRLGMDIKASK